MEDRSFYDKMFAAVHNYALAVLATDWRVHARGGRSSNAAGAAAEAAGVLCSLVWCGFFRRFDDTKGAATRSQ